MQESRLRVTYIGGPTALIEWGGLRLLTDPTFDPAGTEHAGPASTLTKTAGPAIDVATLGPVDVVLLSHDHHADNLDRAGRETLESAGVVLTTTAGSKRLGGAAIGLEPWASIGIEAPGGKILRVTATPARHGPVGGDRGPVIGFVLEFSRNGSDAVYVSGDTVAFEGVAEVALRHRIAVAFLFLGAAKVAAAGPSHLTMTAEEGATVAAVLPGAAIVPLHFEGWKHFSEGRAEIEAAFAAAGLTHRLHFIPPGRAEGLPTTVV
ncbi:MAG TPA: MBL fold metallo-hydrolase [Candidatus Polarisedimenticolaceae bacterium]